jgi:hypothetical protein
MRMHTITLAVVLILGTLSTALAGDGVQITPDGTQILVNKDVGNERWSMSLSLTEVNPLDVNGSIFRRDGGPAGFLHCPLRDVSGSADDIRNAVFFWDCYVADRCAAPPCRADQWHFVATINLRGSFFLP